MSAEVKKEIELEIAHVLFLDIVGYSKLSVNEQHATIEELNEIVRLSEQFGKAEAANRIIKIPTGDGMALVFYKSPEEPAQCAFEVSRSLKGHSRLQIRMGIHSGPVSGVVDVNERANVAGAGINMAQRVMDCGDAGHILLSHHVAEDLAEYERWRPYLHDLGECEVKHGVRVHVVNLQSDTFGNSRLPKKFDVLKKRRAHVRWTAAATGLAGVVAIIAVFFFVSQRSKSPLPEKSVAVLPFENLSEDKSNAYFATGIQDEILTRLAGLRELKVISRSSTEKYPSRPQNLRTIGAELGVATILEGSVQKLAKNAHINVQLINASTDAHIWADSYDRTLENVFAVEGEVAQSIADALKLKLLPTEVIKLNALPTQNAKAYDFFFKGEYGLDRSWKSGAYEQTLKPAIGDFHEAITLDPQFALAFAQLAYSELSQYHFGLVDSGATHIPELLAIAREHIDRALHLQPDLAAGRCALGWWYYWGKSDFAPALTEFRRALAIDPRLFRASLGIAAIAARKGRPDEAIDVLTKQLEFDPRNVLLLRNLGAVCRMRRDFAHEVELQSRAVALDPASELDAINLSEAIGLRSGDVEAAFQVLEPVPAELQRSQVMAEHKVSLFMLRRDFVAAEKIIEDVPNENWRSDWRRPLLLAEIQRALGRNEVARQTFQLARSLITAAMSKDPDEPLIHADLASVDAELGFTDEALREADRAIDLQPVEKDAYRGPQWLVSRAAVNAQLRRIDETIRQLEQLVAMPVFAVSAWELKLDPSWDSVRSDPRFQKLILTEEAQETH